MKCDVEPNVAPDVTLPGFAFACAIISSMVSNGALPAAPIISGVIVTFATASKPL